MGQLIWCKNLFADPTSKAEIKRKIGECKCRRRLIILYKLILKNSPVKMKWSRFSLCRCHDTTCKHFNLSEASLKLPSWLDCRSVFWKTRKLCPHVTPGLPTINMIYSCYRELWWPVSDIRAGFFVLFCLLFFFFF